MLAAAALELQGQASDVSTEVRIDRFTSFRLGGPASILIEPATETRLAAVGLTLASYGIDILILGRGTNVLVSDEGFKGAVIRLTKAFEWIRDEPPFVVAGGAVPLPQVSNWAARRSFSGLEFAVAIPATVGGSVKMNAGAHGSDVSEVLESAVICHLTRGELDVMSAEQMQMSYRQTNLGADDIVCSARFKLAQAKPEKIGLLMERYRSHRSETQPIEARNAGSMFRNPPGMSAGALIEASGLKGFQHGGAEVSAKHANFFIAESSATAQDVYNLMVHVQSAVREATQVLLIPEVRLVGHFDETLGQLAIA
ncbi:MAG: UDP-N-acetylmuramate dehydrogenase [Actinomycetota bacterium]